MKITSLFLLMYVYGTCVSNNIENKTVVPVHINIGDNMTFVCPCNDSNHVSWFRNNTRINEDIEISDKSDFTRFRITKNSTNEYMLFIEKTMAEDFTEYSCEMTCDDALLTVYFNLTETDNGILSNTSETIPSTTYEPQTTLTDKTEDVTSVERNAPTISQRKISIYIASGVGGGILLLIIIAIIFLKIKKSRKGRHNLDKERNSKPQKLKKQSSITNSVVLNVNTDGPRYVIVERRRQQQTESQSDKPKYQNIPSIYNHVQINDSPDGRRIVLAGSKS